jgi:hypothetical protein
VALEVDLLSRQLSLVQQHEPVALPADGGEREGRRAH